MLHRRRIGATTSQEGRTKKRTRLFRREQLAKSNVKGNSRRVKGKLYIRGVKQALSDSWWLGHYQIGIPKGCAAGGNFRNGGTDNQEGEN